jgi:hypothetical protein
MMELADALLKIWESAQFYVKRALDLWERSIALDEEVLHEEKN